MQRYFKFQKPKRFDTLTVTSGDFLLQIQWIVADLVVVISTAAKKPLNATLNKYVAIGKALSPENSGLCSRRTEEH
ncbi:MULTISPECIES: hypothetical protein [unclassified Pedobacter]|uniref:hypothetical protein n=1 Tax=unclassified Pedobacter TaxID=2628915 RepID=UPI001E5FA531|nr:MULTISPECIES: hypothetical protein [unclassified Pedobacter]